MIRTSYRRLWRLSAGAAVAFAMALAHPWLLAQAPQPAKGVKYAPDQRSRICRSG